ncbi:hemolysin family protein [Methylogaea oryzae]|uniref:hemolysin family protein n=1 Tax=Methylogaea oryzae TaxID=1295382 RepID=UPI0020D18488|nr:hemolysin family protein [Methylogaea oryzae]
MAQDPTQFLSTIQVGITLIGILNGAFGESAIAEKLQTYFATVPELSPYAKPLSLVCMVLAITYVSLIVGELVPKRLAMRRPERIASFMAKPMRLLAVSAYPLVKLLSVSTELILRLVGGKHRPEPSITEEEIKVLMEQGAEEGVFEHTEHEWIANIFHLHDRKIESIMTPRNDIVFLDVNEPAEAVRAKLARSSYSRFPVCRGRFEHVVGMVQAKDILNRVLNGESLNLISAVKQPIYAPLTLSLTQLLEVFKRSQVHMALVVDEYGEIEGLVTLQDVMEAIVGDIPTPESVDKPEIVRREDGSWLIDGAIALNKLKKLFDLDEFPGEDSDEFHTLGGFVMSQLGRVPKAADHFHHENLRFEVVDMDGNRVDKVLVSFAADDTPPPVERG